MLTEIKITDSNKWDKTVRSFKTYDVFYLNSYVKAFQNEGHGIPVLIYYESENQRAINVIMKRDIADDVHFQGILEKNKYYDLSSPYGYGGFLSDDSLSSQLIKEYEDYCKSKGYICEFVRFSLLSEYINCFHGVCETHSHNVVRSLDIPLEVMKSDFEYKVRKNLKRAEKNQLRAIVDKNAVYLDDFLRIYYGTMTRSDAKEGFYFKRDFFNTLNSMTENCVYFHVFYEDKVIASELVLYGPENCYSFLGGTDKNFFELRPTEFLKFSIIKWAKDRGLKNFILGGGYGADDGIYRYKKSLSPNGVVEFYIGKKIFNQEEYQNLVEFRKKQGDSFSQDSPFFPLYRS